MPNRVPLACFVLCLAASVTWAASVERARELYLSGDLENARGELHELLADEADASRRASALELLGQLEVDLRNWSAALDAWGELTNRHALSEEAAAISPAIRPLQALVDCACEAAAESAATTASSPPAGAIVESAAPPAPAPATSVPTSAPTPAVPAPAPAAGLLLVGGWGAEYEASQEVTRDLVEFLESNGVGVRAASTEVAAVRGEEAVLSFLLDEARGSGAEGVIFVTTRFDFREYLQVRGYDPNGAELWSDRIAGGTALKERRDRGKPNWNLVDRVKKRLSKRLGTPELPTG